MFWLTFISPWIRSDVLIQYCAFPLKVCEIDTAFHSDFFFHPLLFSFYFLCFFRFSFLYFFHFFGSVYVSAYLLLVYLTISSCRPENRFTIYVIYIYIYILHFSWLATGWTVRGSNPGGGKIFRTCPDRPWGPPSLLYNGYRVFPGSKERPGRDADPSLPSSAVVMKE